MVHLSNENWKYFFNFISLKGIFSPNFLFTGKNPLHITRFGLHVWGWAVPQGLVYGAVIVQELQRKIHWEGLGMRNHQPVLIQLDFCHILLSNISVLKTSVNCISCSPGMQQGRDFLEMCKSSRILSTHSLISMKGPADCPFFHIALALKPNAADTQNVIWSKNPRQKNFPLRAH